MNTAATVIRPRLMSPCICRYCLDGRVTYHTTQAECVQAIHSPLFYLLGSSLHPCRPPPCTHPSDPLIHSHMKCTFSLRWWADLLSTGNREIEMITLSLHTRVPTFCWGTPTHTHTYKHGKAFRCACKHKKKRNRTFNRVPLKFSSEHVQRYTETYKIPLINTSCPTAKTSWSSTASGRQSLKFVGRAAELSRGFTS